MATSVCPNVAELQAFVIGDLSDDDLERIIFSHSGITAMQKLREPDELRRSPEPVPGEFTVKIAADVPPGIYEVRARAEAHPHGVAPAQMPRGQRCEHLHEATRRAG